MSDVIPTENDLVSKLRKRADNWQVWIDDDLEAEVGYLPDHMRYHQALDRSAADEIERLRDREKMLLDAHTGCGCEPTCAICREKGFT